GHRLRAPRRAAAGRTLDATAAEGGMIEFLGEVGAFLSSPDNWWGPRGLAVRTRDHLLLSAFAVAVAAAIALPPALWLRHRRRAAGTVRAIVNIGGAIPSCGMAAIMLPTSLWLGLGLGVWPTFVALVALVMPPFFTTT